MKAEGNFAGFEHFEQIIAPSILASLSNFNYQNDL